MQTLADAIKRARQAATNQGSEVLLLATLANGERLVIWVGAETTRLVEGK